MNLDADMESLISMARADLLTFKNSRIYLTGGTGFIGSWILESIVRANARLRSNISVDVLSRDPSAFFNREPELCSSPGVRIIRGDVCNRFASDASYDAVVHAATPVAARLTPRQTLETIVSGDAATLEVAARSGRIPFLYTSSGAIYGRQPRGLKGMHEDYSGAPDPLNPSQAYHHGKRTGELLCALAASENRLLSKIARLFSFIGPRLPLDRHFAAGNFIGHALASEPIVVEGDGTSVRSYLYCSDMTAWLWAILARGTTALAYNVGSEMPTDIACLAGEVSKADGNGVPVEIRGAPSPLGRLPERYVPDTRRVRSSLGVSETVNLAEGLRRTLLWYRAQALDYRRRTVK